ncbi:MAG: hypothetical protein U1B84_31170, partial [Variovorax sp.]|nr:hypothetical protein [Variovorax sp.]
MTREARRLLALLGAWGLLLPAQAQPNESPAASTAPAYVDRVMEGLAPATDADGEGPAYDRSGWPRFLRLETRLGTQPFDQARKARIGYGIYGLLETPNHGTLSVDGTYAPRDSSGTLTLRQRGMPVTGGWLASHELGVITPPAPGIMRLPSRIFVPSAIVQGASADWENPGSGVQLQASTGEPGRLDFLPASGFRKLPGQRTSFGGQWRINAGDTDPLSRQGWTVALQHEDARRVSNLDVPTATSEIVDADSTLLALRHEGAEHRIQGQVVRTRSSDVSGERNGFWIDGEWDEGPRKHGAGAYRLEPDLSWAQLPLASDILGAYVRSSWRTRQWSAEGSIDWLDSVTNRSSGSGFFATGSARWRLNRDHSLGAGSTVRRFAG